MTCLYDYDEQCLGGCPNCPRKDYIYYADPERAGGHWTDEEDEEDG